MFEIVDVRRTDDDEWTPEHGYTISSPCEPNDSGELKIASINEISCSNSSESENYPAHKW